MGTIIEPRHATVYDIPERPRAPIPNVPLLRYVEDCSPTSGSGTDEEHCLTGYGEVTISEYHDALDTGEDEHRRRVPRLRHTRPRSKNHTETTRAGPGPVRKSDSGESLFTGDVGQLEPEYLSNPVEGTSVDHPLTPNENLRAFFENLRNGPKMMRQRTLVLQNSPASEAIDARPRAN